MEKYFVNTAMLNVRSTPEKRVNNIIARIQKFRIVDLIEKTKSDWWKINFRDGSEKVQGYVASRYLFLLAEMPEIVENVSGVHLVPDPRADLNSDQMMHKPIGDSSIDHRNINDPIESKKQALWYLADKLDVTHSKRYKRTSINTFCNIYAFDFCYFSDAYLPRVWWNGKAINQLTKGQPVEVKYGETVYEQNANSLHNWLQEWGDDFGWKRVQDVDTMQNLINENGGLGLICARRKDLSKSGHITVVLPESGNRKATRANGKVIYPLQSQAGAINYKYFSAESAAWWTMTKFGSFVFYYHD